MHFLNGIKTSKENASPKVLEFTQLESNHSFLFFFLSKLFIFYLPSRANAIMQKFNKTTFFYTDVCIRHAQKHIDGNICVAWVYDS